ncbi:carboxymuconolactone decarboxylase family protein [Nocardia thailandica]|uniref:Carboxymuconolactone decarboxylase family protein n=1 Tax=Nocardia thailandica TaxID=257275 RepID=A0ABW6PUN9_9NOCA
MEPRYDLFQNKTTAGFVKRLVMAGKVIDDSTLPKAVYELVKIRASQINGCAYCTDMHTKDAAHAGESAVRINLVAAWHEATVFTEAERAALALTEEATRAADGGRISDDTWAKVREHYDDDQIGGLIAAIATINAWNRLNAIARTPAGDYVPGQWG